MKKQTLLATFCLMITLLFSACQSPSFSQSFGDDVLFTSTASNVSGLLSIEYNVSDVSENISEEKAEQRLSEQLLIEGELTMGQVNYSMSDSFSNNRSEAPVSQSAKPVDRVFVEGALIQLKQQSIIDPDGDPINVFYSKPFDENGSWQTKVGDAGTYTINITASDGKLDSVRTFVIEVLSLNKKPVISVNRSIIAKEGERIELAPVITDDDSANLVVSYSGFMNTSSYQTTSFDAGQHSVLISVSDGINQVTETVFITIEDVNRLPTIQSVYDEKKLQDSQLSDEFSDTTSDASSLSFVEGDLISLIVNASDLDSDTLTFSFSKPLNSTGQWQTQKGDVGTYDITVFVSDNKSQVSRDVRLVVGEINTPPAIQISTELIVNEGDMITLNPIITDADGDNVSVSYRGFMTSAQQQTAYDDAGTHSVIITADDKKSFAEKTVTITILDVNRPPVFLDDVFS